MQHEASWAPAAPRPQRADTKTPPTPDRPQMLDTHRELVPSTQRQEHQEAGETNRGTELGKDLLAAGLHRRLPPEGMTRSMQRRVGSGGERRVARIAEVKVRTRRTLPTRSA
jgi:hypothetical protein